MEEASGDQKSRWVESRAPSSERVWIASAEQWTEEATATVKGSSSFDGEEKDWMSLIWILAIREFVLGLVLFDLYIYIVSNPCLSVFIRVWHE